MCVIVDGAQNYCQDTGKFISEKIENTKTLLSCQLMPEFRWRYTTLLLKQATEIQRIIITDNICNLCNIIRSGFQQILSIGNAQRENILRWCGTGIFFKIPNEPTDTRPLAMCIIFYIDGIMIMIMKIGN